MRFVKSGWATTLAVFVGGLSSGLGRDAGAGAIDSTPYRTIGGGYGSSTGSGASITFQGTSGVATSGSSLDLGTITVDTSKPVDDRFMIGVLFKSDTPSLLAPVITGEVVSPGGVGASLDIKYSPAYNELGYKISDVWHLPPDGLVAGTILDGMRATLRIDRVSLGIAGGSSTSESFHVIAHFDIAPVPEPATIAFGFCGLLALGYRHCRKPREA